MSWTRNNPCNPHDARVLHHAEPFALVAWSLFDGDWRILTDRGADSTDNLPTWCTANGLPVPSDDDQQWSKQ